jgi:UTP:GlnB (protein PII) uridylyltransferase
MTRASQALRAASDLRYRFVRSGGYGLAYGSRSAGTATATSDLDLVFITPRRLRSDRLADMVNAVLQLHHDHGLALDTEVDHSVKVHATLVDVAAAVSLRCFPLDADGRLEVSPVVVEP